MKYVDALMKIKKFFQISGLPYTITVPYTHVVQIGDPVLRRPAHLVDKDEISSDFVQKVTYDCVLYSIFRSHSG